MYMGVGVLFGASVCTDLVTIGNSNSIDISREVRSRQVLGR
jgi:hypothetical protein